MYYRKVLFPPHFQLNYPAIQPLNPDAVQSEMLRI